MIGRFFGVLFYPWIYAICHEAYFLYSLSSLYQRRVDFGGREHAFKQYVIYNLFDFWAYAFSRFWFRIIFTPWRVLEHPDLKRYGGKDEYYRNIRANR